MFQHSSQTVHKYFHEALVAMMKFSKEMIIPLSFNDNASGITNVPTLKSNSVKLRNVIDLVW